ncbi:hypothetical protein [Pyxidicoccus sp. MSG2]|uniref:hypothetical protein n=1 Tax=Pyxidicoccus sp. MSG2 TaxID=2996790 RepID=UPI002271CBEA|nr:hypothetical protein [Pyxidicoccus sp. MSG2]MCY1018659.1 hypothetical protein [Pyxidicoccus sp. MSG2]
MRTPIPRHGTEQTRASQRIPRSALLPMLVGVLLPKCPVCIAVYLSAIGTGASTAQGAAPLLVHAGNALVVLALGVLGMRVMRARRYGLIALFAISAGALLTLALAFPTLFWPRLVALTGVGISVLCAMSQSRQAGFTTRTSKRFVYHRLRQE